MSKKRFNSNNKVIVEKDNYVYKFYNLKNELLYVGITNHPMNRFRQHKKDKDWFHEVNKICISDNFYRNEASLYEIYYISNELPKYNVDFINGGIISFDLPEIIFKELILDDGLDNNHNFPETITKNLEELSKRIDKKYLAEKLIDFFNKVKENKNNFCLDLIKSGILSDKGLSKAKLKDLFNSKTDTFKKALNRPIIVQYIKDNNIDVHSNNRYIKLS